MIELQSVQTLDVVDFLARVYMGVSRQRPPRLDPLTVVVHFMEHLDVARSHDLVLPIVEHGNLGI